MYQAFLLLAAAFLVMEAFLVLEVDLVFAAKLSLEPFLEEEAFHYLVVVEAVVTFLVMEALAFLDLQLSLS